MSDVIFKKLPGGFALITGGGTRDKINLSRPWQTALPIAPEKCPLCTKPQEEIKVPGIPSGWKVLPNPSNRHANHHLIIPTACWNAQTLQVLGGVESVHQALETALLAMAHTSTSEMALFIHVGQCAGQNLGHAHWHLMTVRVQKPLIFPAFYFHGGLVVKSFRYLDIFAGGARAGECFIFTPHQLLFSNKGLAELARVIDWIVSRGNEKFRSTQGHPPEFIVSVRISAEGYLRYANYCPILNMWGAPENVFAQLEGGPITLAWPHEVTANYLRE